jgi:hypothetical protein
MLLHLPPSSHQRARPRVIASAADPVMTGVPLGCRGEHDWVLSRAAHGRVSVVMDLICGRAAALPKALFFSFGGTNEPASTRDFGAPVARRCGCAIPYRRWASDRLSLALGPRPWALYKTQIIAQSVIAAAVVMPAVGRPGMRCRRTLRCQEWHDRARPIRYESAGPEGQPFRNDKLAT